MADTAHQGPWWARGIAWAVGLLAFFGARAVVYRAADAVLGKPDDPALTLARQEHALRGQMLQVTPISPVDVSLPDEVIRKMGAQEGWGRRRLRQELAKNQKAREEYVKQQADYERQMTDHQSAIEEWKREGAALAAGRTAQ